MKLPTPTMAKKRIRRVRKTIYEDPGNPFNVASTHSESDEAEEEEYEESEEEEEDDEEDYFVNDAPPPGFWGPNDTSPAFSGSGRHLSHRHEFDSILGSDTYQGHGGFDARDEPMHAPTPQRIGTPSVIREHSIPVLDDSIFRRFDENLSSNGKDAAPLNGNVGSRDTEYYGFYDDVLEEYRRSVADLEGRIEAVPGGR